MAVATEPESIEAIAEATPEFEAGHKRQRRRHGLLLALPAYAYLVLFFVVPFLIVIVYSFATRSRFGTELSGWNLESYKRLFDPFVLRIIVRSGRLALISTLICLFIAYPFAYFMSTRKESVRNVMLVLVMIPFWTNFLVRTYAWRVILGNNGPYSQLAEGLGFGESRLLFTEIAVVLGLVYGYLPFMVLPLYAAIERIDNNLLEASRDLYATGFGSFRHVLLPLSMPGVIAGSILVFVPSFGAYVTPAILGGSKDTLLGSYIVTQFLSARDFPFGAALSFVLMIVMLTATLLYFRKGGQTL